MLNIYLVSIVCRFNDPLVTKLLLLILFEELKNKTGETLIACLISIDHKTFMIINREQSPMLVMHKLIIICTTKQMLDEKLTK